MTNGEWRMATWGRRERNPKAGRGGGSGLRCPSFVCREIGQRHTLRKRQSRQAIWQRARRARRSVEVLPIVAWRENSGFDRSVINNTARSPKLRGGKWKQLAN